MARLEEIVRLLERGEAPLNESMKLFEEGTKLSASLGKLLDKAEQKVTVMQENMQGELDRAAICGRGGSKMTFSEQLKADIALIEPALEKYLSRETGEGYDRIFEAAKYSAMAGGKRLRPVIVLEFCRLCGGDIEKALPFACALEMIHTYSLIHDDLPCMDDDDLRRGRPTCHKAFDEATAVLAGDGLLTAAFETASAGEGCSGGDHRALHSHSGRERGHERHDRRSGARYGARSTAKSRSTSCSLLQKLKTGCLLRAACELGLRGGRCDRRGHPRCGHAHTAKSSGLAFQIQDDILDIEGDARNTRKIRSARMRQDEKSTFPSLLGLEECRELAAKLTEEAVDGGKTGWTVMRSSIELARSLTGRTR